jgi:hypothetical protein
MMLIDKVMEIFTDDIAGEDARSPAVHENFATQLLICRSRGFLDEVILQSHQLIQGPSRCMNSARRLAAVAALIPRGTKLDPLDPIHRHWTRRAAQRWSAQVPLLCWHTVAYARTC